MTDIPDEAVEAAVEALDLVRRESPTLEWPWEDDVRDMLTAALPYLGNYTADLCEEIERKDARIKELEEEVDRLEAERKALLKIQEQAARATSESGEVAIATLVEAAVDALSPLWRRELVRDDVETVIRTALPLTGGTPLGRPTMAQLEWHVEALAALQQRHAEVCNLASDLDAENRRLRALLPADDDRTTIPEGSE